MQGEKRKIDRRVSGREGGREGVLKAGGGSFSM